MRQMGGTMRSQASLEIIIYLVIAVAALAASIYAYESLRAKMAFEINREYMMDLVSLINSNMEYQKSDFSAFVPQYICNSTFDGRYIKNSYGTFGLYNPVSLSNFTCVASGRYSTLTLSYEMNGTFRLGMK